MPIHIDEKFKDASPIETVNVIINILESAGLSVTEEWNESGLSDCFSCRVTIDGTGVGVNGKGVTKELARASGYAELMERLQSGLLSLPDGSAFKDGKYVTKEELTKDSMYVFEAISKSVSRFLGKEVSAARIADDAVLSDNNSETTFALPYYDIINDTYVYMPYKFVLGLYSSTGLAAGNSLEEAIVQGFSEIVERYCQKKFFTDKLTPPNIPDDILKNYSTSYRIITQIREAGYDVIVKDCSLGYGFPTIASVFLDKRKHTYHVHFGASPVFEIALERSLTETFQGRSIESAASVENVLFRETDGELKKNYYASKRTGTCAYPIEFFGDNPSYSMISPDNHENCSNKDLLKEVLAFAEKLNCHILVRDMSHMGFGTYRIIVPGVNESFFPQFTQDIPFYPMLNDINAVRKNILSASAEQLYYLRTVFNIVLGSVGIDIRYSSLSGLAPVTNRGNDRFLGHMMLAYIEWEHRNYSAWKKYLSASRFATDESDKTYIDCLGKAYEKMNKGLSLEDTMHLLSHFYTDDIIQCVKSVIENNENPFRRFIIQCDPENCSECKYVNTCMIKSRGKLAGTLERYISAFDNEGAFEKIRNIFKDVKSE